jgi:hypothetical protein
VARLMPGHRAGLRSPTHWSVLPAWARAIMDRIATPLHRPRRRGSLSLHKPHRSPAWARAPATQPQANSPPLLPNPRPITRRRLGWVPCPWRCGAVTRPASLALPDAPRYASAGKDSRSRPVMPLPPGLSPVGAGRLALWLLSRRSQRAQLGGAQRSQTGFGIHRHGAIVLSV